MDPKSNIEEDESVSSASVTSEKKKPNYPGPKPGVQYPLSVIYCGGIFKILKNNFYNRLILQFNFDKECNLTVDLCEFTQNPEACKEWLEKNHPDFSTKMNELKSN
jgi:hypothetical protein